MAQDVDIAEKIADLLFEQTPRTADYLLRTGSTLIKGVEEISNTATKELLEATEKKKGKQDLLQLHGEVTPTQMNEFLTKFGMKSRTVRVPMSDVQDFEAILKRFQVLYAKMSMAKDDGEIFIYLERDSAKVGEAYELLKAQRSEVTEMPAKMYVEYMAPDTVQTLSGLDDVEISLFRHYARNLGLLYTVLGQKNGTHLVAYDVAESSKAHRAMLHTGWDLTGANGALYRKQVEYMLEGRNKILYSAAEAAQELYIVSRDRPGTYIHITEADYTLYKAGKAVSNVSRNQHNFTERCISDCMSLPGAVVLEPEQYSSDMGYEDLINYPTISLHVSEYDEQMETSRINSFINLVQRKSGLDNEANTVFGLEDSNVSYSEYSGYEFIMDTDERISREREFTHFKNAAYYSQNHLKEDTFPMNQKSVDYIIARAEQRREAASEPVPIHEKTTSSREVDISSPFL